MKPYKIIRLRDNNFLVSLGQKDEMGKEQVRLIKFDLQKNLLIDQKITTSYSSALKDIKEFSDGSLMGVGYVRDNFNTDALVMLFDSSLNLLHQEHYGDENYDELNALCLLHNSQVAAVGIFTPKNSQESKMWILKLDRNGIISKKQKITQKQKNVSKKSSKNLYKELLKLFEDDIKKDFLSISEDLDIKFIHKNLYFKVGKHKLSKAQKSYLRSFWEKLVKFLDAHRQQIKSLEINGHTSSEWKGVNFTKRYLKNEKLSMRRSYSVISYIFTNQPKETQKFLSKIIKGSGFGFSKKVYKDTQEDRQKSRRVSFKIVL